MGTEGKMIWRIAMLAVWTIVGAAAQTQGAPADARALGISFLESSGSNLVLERNGKKYLVDVAARSVRELVPGDADAGGQTAGETGKNVFGTNCATCHGADGKGKAEFRTPDFTDPKVQASLTDAQLAAAIRNGKRGTAMPAWAGKLSDQEISAVAVYIRSLGSGRQLQGKPAAAESGSTPNVYQPGDDRLMSLPTGRPLAQHGVVVDFAHRFAFDPAFSGPARGRALAGLDGVGIASFGFAYGITSRLSVSAYRSPSLIARPIQLMAAYSVGEESRGAPLNVAIRVSVEGQNDFAKNYTENIELILSRSITGRAQFYFVPTVSFNDRRLVLVGSFRSSAIPDVPGVNTFSTGVGAAVDIRPTVALVAEVIPTLVNGRPLGIHRPAYAFGIQKKILRHAFTFGFTNSPGTTVSQRAGTRAAFLGNPGADKPSGLFIGFNLMRELH
jgi:mono/diheme cytochrome c family protein